MRTERVPSLPAGWNCDDNRMVAERKFERTDVGWRLDGLNANSWIVDPYGRPLEAKMNRHTVLAAQAFIPHDQLERAVAVLQEQIVNGPGLAYDLEVELPGRGEDALVRQNGRQVVKIGCGLTG
jgi:hypothetical protein